VKLYVVVSFMRAIRGARYEVQSAYPNPEIAEIEIREAAERDGVELERVDGSDRTFKGGGVLVTIHEVEVDGLVGSLAERSHTLGEDPFPFATRDETARMRDKLTTLNKRQRDACLLLRDSLGGLTPPGPETVARALKLLDPDHLFDDGD